MLTVVHRNVTHHNLQIKHAVVTQRHNYNDAAMLECLSRHLQLNIAHMLMLGELLINYCCRLREILLRDRAAIRLIDNAQLKRSAKS